MNLIKAEENDLKLIHELQVRSFHSLLEKYRDYDTNPASEPFEKIRERYYQEETLYYLILNKGLCAGGIRVILSEESHRVSPLFIVPEARGQGLGRGAMKAVEEKHPHSLWKVETILQEEGLNRLYRSLGYIETGKKISLKEGMDIVFYEKRCVI